MKSINDCLVSVIVPVYNGAAFIEEALVSVKRQTHHHLECIIVDDGSGDNTAAIVEQLIKADSRFHYVYQDNKGLSGARNTGLGYARGNFVQFLDADDVLLPSKIEKQLKDVTHTMDSDDMIVSYTDYSTGKSSNIFEPHMFYRSPQFKSADYMSELINRWETDLIIPPHCFLFTRNFFFRERIQFDIHLPNHEDFDCWLNIFKLRPRVRYLDEKLCIYRITDDSMSKKMKLMGEGFLQVLDKHIRLSKQSAGIKKLLVKKRREVLRRYNRFDKMSFKDKFILMGYISNYYRRRILQKIGLLP